MYQVLHQGGALDGNGGLGGKRLEIADPFRVRFEDLAVKGFQDTLDLSLNDQRSGVMLLEVLVCRQREAAEVAARFAQVRAGNRAIFLGCAPRASLPKFDMRLFDFASPETKSRRIVERVGYRIQHQDADGVHFEFISYVAQYDVEGDVQVEVGTDGHIDLVQGGQVTQLLFSLLVEHDAMNSIGGNVGDGIQEAQILIRDLDLTRDPQCANGLILSNERYGGDTV